MQAIGESIGLIAGFKVPIVLEPKFGARFGALQRFTNELHTR